MNSENADRTITPTEVKAWFGKSKQQKLKPDIYINIAAGLTKLRWPRDPPAKVGTKPMIRKSGL